MPLTVRTLDDLADFTQLSVKEAPPAVAASTVLRSPGLSSSEIERLRAELPGLPEDYLSIASRFRLGPVELAAFMLGPGGHRDGPLVDRLIKANSPDGSAAYAHLRARELLQVASVEIDPVCVRRCGASERAGEVVWIDISSGPGPVATPLAPDFKTFLIVAGRLEEAVEKQETLDDVLEGYISDAHQREGWAAIASMILGSLP